MPFLLFALPSLGFDRREKRVIYITVLICKDESGPGARNRQFTRGYSFAHSHQAPLRRAVYMTEGSQKARGTFSRWEMSEFWSGDLGLTLVTISLAVLIFVVMPLRHAGLPLRALMDILIVALMIFGSLDVNQSRLATVVMIAIFLVTAVVLVTARLYPTLFLYQLGSILTTVTLLLYVRIVLLLMFRRGPITWSRMQGGICAYLLVGLAWGSAFEFVERIWPGSFSFVNPAANIDALSAKLTYFSFSTLTTVGFGDVTAVLPAARSLAVAEAIVGQLFPAILIGALVAMALQYQQKS